MMNKSHVFSTIAICLVVCQVAVVILSWILTAAFPNLPLRSVLSGEGIRWMVGSFSKSVAAVYMMWLFFGTIAVGCLQYSGLSYVLRKKQSNYRERMALKIVYGECIIVVAIISLMIFLPHSIFLNVSGNLFPGCLSDGLLSVVTLVLCLISITYGLASGHLVSSRDVFASLTFGIGKWSSVFVIYILAAILYHTVYFVTMPKDVSFYL